MDEGRFAVFVGLDVGKGEHHACALDARGTRLHDPARGGKKRLKRARFLSAFAARHDTDSRTYYDRKRAQGKKHNAALICLASVFHAGGDRAV
jgi:hypothetical protein